MRDYHYKTGTDWASIGKALGVSRETARAIYRRALDKLRARVSHEDFWPSPAFQPARSYRRHPGSDHYSPKYEEDRPPASDYQDWLPENTRVVSGPVGDFKFPGRRFGSYAEAKAYVLSRWGRIHQEHQVIGRYIFRVPLTRTVS